MTRESSIVVHLEMTGSIRDKTVCGGGRLLEHGKLCERFAQYIINQGLKSQSNVITTLFRW